MLLLFCCKIASRLDSAPVAAKRMPDTKPVHLCIPLYITDHLSKSVGELFSFGRKVIECVSMHRQPAVIHQHPAHRYIFFRKFSALCANLFFTDLRIKCIPAAPAKIFQHLRHIPFLFQTDSVILCRPGHTRMNRFLQTVRLRICINRLVQFADSALAGAHSENKRILSSGLYLGLKLFSRHWKQEKVSVSQLSVNRLCQLRNFRKVIDKCRSCPPVV